MKFIYFFAIAQIETNYIPKIMRLSKLNCARPFFVYIYAVCCGTRFHSKTSFASFQRGPRRAYYVRTCLHFDCIVVYMMLYVHHIIESFLILIAANMEKKLFSPCGDASKK